VGFNYAWNLALIKFDRTNPFAAEFAPQMLTKQEYARMSIMQIVLHFISANRAFFTRARRTLFYFLRSSVYFDKKSDEKEMGRVYVYLYRAD